MDTKLFLRSIPFLLCYTFLLGVQINYAQTGLIEGFNTLRFKADSQNEAFLNEAAVYDQMDSIKYIQSLRQSLDSVPDPSVNPDISKLKRTAAAQTLYYESLIDSLMFENFKLKIDLAVIERKINNMAASRESNDNIATNVHGRYRQHDDLTIESLIAEIVKNGIKHPRVVLAQAILETGWFKSRVCHTHNNLFGLRQPWDGEYFRFDRWQDSVKAYRTKVQYKYKGGPYLKWLKDLGYAEDPDYTDKLKILLSGPLKDY